MISINFGLWKSESGVLSGNIKIFGKEFICYVNQNTTKSGNQPDYQVTIKEAYKNDSKTT